MRFIVKGLLTLGVVGSLLSCGSSTSGTSSKRPDRDRAAGNRVESLESFSESDVYCAVPGKECPNNVAKLTMRWKEEGEYRIGFCSGTLVGPDLIITNRHCIPPGFQRNGADCKNAIVALFPKTKTGEREKLDCLNVVQVFPDEADQPDMAVIKVERTKFRRDPLTLVKNSLSHGDQLTAYTMDPGSGVYGSIRKKTCKVSQDDIYYFNQDSFAGNMVISGDNCNVIGGNSGSSIRNENGEIVGLIHSRLDTSTLRQIFTSISIKTEFLDYAGVMVNMGCMASIYQAAPKTCEIYQQTKDGLKNYLDQKVIDNGVIGIDESTISFKVKSDLGVEMKQSETTVSFYSFLDKVRRDLTKLYFGEQKHLVNSIEDFEN